MKIKVTSVYVDDQDKALRFYTEVLGFAKKTDFSQGPYRWLTVASPEEADGTELQLALNSNPAAKAYQQAIFQQSQPAAMFFTDDVQADYERMKAQGAEFTMPPTDVTASKIAMLNDTCGNLIQVTQLMKLVGADKEKRMSDREQYAPGPAYGAQVRKDGEKWTLILVRELRHPPAMVWQALTDPAHLCAMGAIRRRSEPGRRGAGEALAGRDAEGAGLRDHREAGRGAEAARVQLGRQRSPLGTRAARQRHASDALAQHRSPLHLVGRGGLAHLFRRAGAAARG